MVKIDTEFAKKYTISEQREEHKKLTDKGFGTIFINGYCCGVIPYRGSHHPDEFFHGQQTLDFFKNLDRLEFGNLYQYKARIMLDLIYLETEVYFNRHVDVS